MKTLLLLSIVGIILIVFIISPYQIYYGLRNKNLDYENYASVPIVLTQLVNNTNESCINYFDNNCKMIQYIWQDNDAQPIQNDDITLFYSTTENGDTATPPNFYENCTDEYAPVAGVFTYSDNGANQSCLKYFENECKMKQYISQNNDTQLLQDGYSNLPNCITECADCVSSLDDCHHIETCTEEYATAAAVLSQLVDNANVSCVNNFDNNCKMEQSICQNNSGTEGADTGIPPFNCPKIYPLTNELVSVVRTETIDGLCQFCIKTFINDCVMQKFCCETNHMCTMREDKDALLATCCIIVEQKNEQLYLDKRHNSCTADEGDMTAIFKLIMTNLVNLTKYGSYKNLTMCATKIIKIPQLKPNSSN